MKVPLPDDVRRALIASMEADNNGQYDYTDFVHQLNWRDNPMCLYNDKPSGFKEDWEGNPTTNLITNINFSTFKDDLLSSVEKKQEKK